MKKYNYLFYESTRFGRLDFRLQIRFRFYRLQCIFSDPSDLVQISVTVIIFRYNVLLISHLDPPDEALFSVAK